MYGENDTKKSYLPAAGYLHTVHTVRWIDFGIRVRVCVRFVLKKHLWHIYKKNLFEILSGLYRRLVGQWSPEMLSGRIEPMDELIYCSHRTVYTNQTICWDPIETERSEATIPRRGRGDAKRQTPRVTAWSVITLTGGSKRPGTFPCLVRRYSMQAHFAISNFSPFNITIFLLYTSYHRI